jgi:hypothetical protein
MTVTQTVEIPESYRLTIDVPREMPLGRAILTFTSAGQESNNESILHECPICARNIDPATGNPRYNAETIAAIEEGIAISRGEIPAKRFSSLDQMLEDLERDTSDN